MRLIDRREGKVHSDGFYLDGRNGKGGIYLGQTKQEALERLIQLIHDIMAEPGTSGTD